MFGNRIEDEFANNVSTAEAAVKDDGSWKLLWVIAIGLAAFIAWAATYKIEETARAVGRVIPSQQVQTVQSLEGGIVRAVNVAEGDIVDAGDVLMQIDDTRFDAERGELLERESAIEAEVARLEAEAQFASEITYPHGLRVRNPLATAAELQVFLSRRDQLSQEMKVLSSQLEQRRSELNEIRAQRTRTRTIMEPLSAEIALTQDMFDRKLVPQIEVLRLQSRMAELTGDIAVSEATELRMLGAISEAENQIEAARSSYVLTARQRLAKLQVELEMMEK